MTEQTDSIIPIHQWTNDGDEVLVLKCIPADGVTRGTRAEWAREKWGATYEFRYPLTVGATVEARDWNPESICGGGIHGWPWGMGIGSGKPPDWTVNSRWIVIGFQPGDVVGVDGKAKGRVATIRHVSEPGNWQTATDFVLPGQMAWVHYSARGSASNSGVCGSASNSGVRGSASNSGVRGSSSNSGDYGSASNSGVRGSSSNSGDYGSASNSGDYGSASNSGVRGSASNSGVRGSASNSGDCGSASSPVAGTAAVSTGLSSRAKAGPYSALALAWWNTQSERREMRCREIGCGDGSDGKLKADVWYRTSDDGEFVEDIA